MQDSSLEQHSPDKRSCEVDCSNADKGCSWKGKLEELEHHRRLLCLKEEVACPYSEVGCEVRCLREELGNHQDQSLKYHLDQTLATVKTLKDELKQNDVRCRNAQCDWRGKSTEEQDAHTAVCPKERIQCPFDEEFRCQQHFHREELNAHLQYHITSLHTQIKTCQNQPLPITFTIPDFHSSVANLQQHNDSDILKEYKFPFYTRQGGYLLRLCVTVKTVKSGNRYIELSVESLPGNYDDRLPSLSAIKVMGKICNTSFPAKAQSFEVSGVIKLQQSRRICGTSRIFDFNDFFPQNDFLPQHLFPQYYPRGDFQIVISAVK